MRRTFVIGDIHGCYQTLKALLAKISPDPQEDVLIFLGDYIDRGPNSKEVITELNSNIKITILDDCNWKKFDNRERGGETATRIINGKQVSGNLILDWKFIILEK